MKGRILTVTAMTGVFLALVTRPAGAMMIINEFLADPAPGLAGDANADGTRSSSQDEFVELFNSGDGAVDLSGWTIHDAVGSRHEFSSGTFIGGSGYFVVFGGGSPNLEDVAFQTASSGQLSLNNGGDTISLFDAFGTLVDTHTYGNEGGDNVALVRSPEGAGGDFVPHNDASDVNALFSPGQPTNPVSVVVTDPGGIITAEEGGTEAGVVPEPTMLLGWGLVFSGLARSRLRRHSGGCSRTS